MNSGIRYLSILVIFISLDFWTKVALHSWLGYGYLEPTGLFDYSPASWDRALTISTTSLLGVFFGKTLFNRYAKKAYMIVLFTRPISLKSNKKCILALTTWALLFLVSLVFAMGLRYGTESPAKASNNQSLNTSEPDDFILKLIEKTSLLIVDRWIGIEGVMAESAYADKNLSLLESALVKRRVRGQMDFYTSKIAFVDLSEEERKTFQYASIPGGIAFFTIAVLSY